MPERWEQEIDELLRRREAKLRREPVSRRAGHNPVAVASQRHFALPKRVGQALAKTQLCALDRPRAAATLGAAARSGFDNVGHALAISMRGLGQLGRELA